MEAIILSLVLATIFTALYYEAGGGMLPGLFMLMGFLMYLMADVMAFLEAYHHRLPWWGFGVVVAVGIVVHVIGSCVLERRIKANIARRSTEESEL